MASYWPGFSETTDVPWTDQLRNAAVNEADIHHVSFKKRSQFIRVSKGETNTLGFEIINNYLGFEMQNVYLNVH